MRLIIVTCIFLIYSTGVLAQQHHVGIYVNDFIDTADTEISQVVQLWKDYLNSNPDSAYDNPYWLTSEKRKYKKFDFLNSKYLTPSLYHLLPYWKVTIMSVSEIDSGYVIRTLFAMQTDSGFTRPFCISQIAAHKEAGQYKLCNILPMNTKPWQREKVGTISFIFPPSHHFNKVLAKRMSAFVDSLTTLWHITAFETEFYFADDLDIIYKMRGLDYYIGEGNKRRPRGSADIANRIVFGGGQNEWYPHEFVHIYIDPLFPNSHEYFLEGYAALLGGSEGHELTWHIKRMHQYLLDHPELDLSDLLAFVHMDYSTDPQYVFGGLLCRMAEEQGGFPLLRNLMSLGRSDDDFYKAIQAIFGVGQKELNSFLRAKIAEYAAK